MKRNVMASVLSLLMLLSLCCGCQGKNGEGGESTNAPDSSRMLYFDEIFSLCQDRPVVWTDVVVQKVYPDIYADEYDWETYLLASCKVQKTFFASPDCPNQTVVSQEGSDCLLWVSVHGIQKADYPKMRELLQRADSFLVYAVDEPAPFGHYGVDEALVQMLEQDGLTCREEEGSLCSPPSLYVKSLYMWELIPIIDGAVDGSVVQRMVEDGRDGEIAYRMDLTDMDWDPPRIVNGDTKEELYQFLEEYVKEHTK